MHEGKKEEEEEKSGLHLIWFTWNEIETEQHINVWKLRPRQWIEPENQSFKQISNGKGGDSNRKRDFSVSESTN